MKLAKASQAEIDALMQWLQAREGKEDGPPPFMRVVFGYETLVQNCCDPALDYLEFSPELLAAKEDSARIDWMDAHEASVAVTEPDPLSCRVQASDDYRGEGFSDPYHIREAIDAARDAIALADRPRINAAGDQS